MSNTETLKRKIETAKDLQSVVKTMKALAAVSIRQYEKAVESLTEYDRTLKMGLQVLLQSNPQILTKIQGKASPHKKLAIVVFGSDQGMCGQFNERIAEFTREILANYSVKPIVLTVGMRIKDRLETLALPSTTSFTIPSSIEGITPIIQETVLTLEKWRIQGQIEQIIVFHNHPTSTASYCPNQVQIYPLKMSLLRELRQQQWQGNSLPIYTMSQEKLASALFQQHFFVSLYRACAESLASENASRLASMQMAEKNIEERLNELQAEFNHQRQTMITEELLDIVSGFEALTHE